VLTYLAFGFNYDVAIIITVIYNSLIGDPPRRLSVWGEQLHERLFAKKDMKEVMRDKLKMNLKQDGSSAPQINHTDIK
jgi:hypothetical protein